MQNLSQWHENMFFLSGAENAKKDYARIYIYVSNIFFLYHLQTMESTQQTPLFEEAVPAIAGTIVNCDERDSMVNFVSNAYDYGIYSPFSVLSYCKINSNAYEPLKGSFLSAGFDLRTMEEFNLPGKKHVSFYFDYVITLNYSCV